MRSYADHARFALRMLLRHKRFSALAIISLAVAIALNTTMYSIVDAVVFPKVEMREPDRLFRITFFGDTRGRIPIADKVAALEATRMFAGMARGWYSAGGPKTAERGWKTRRITTTDVSTNYFSLLGVKPAAGRLISAADAAVEPRSVVLSVRLWKELFPDREYFDTATIILGNEPRMVVGLLDAKSDFPRSLADAWQLPASDSRFHESLFNVVRLADGVTLAQAYTELQLIAARFAIQAGERPSDARFSMDSEFGAPLSIGSSDFAIVGAVISVLLIACFNLANLQLSRGVSRAREFATRAAVGATRGDIIRQILAETAVLAGVGLALALLLTLWGIEIIRTTLAPTASQYFRGPQISWRLFAVGSVAMLISLLIVGVYPAIRVSRVAINDALKLGAGTGLTRSARRHYSVLVVLQIALSLVLLAGAALLGRAAASLYTLDINPILERIVSASAFLQATGPSDKRRLSDVAGVIVARARAVPGVADAAAIMYEAVAMATVTVTDDGGTPIEVAVGQAAYRLVTPSYLRTMGIPVTRGRDFTEGESTEALVVVDSRTARLLWPNGDPINKMIRFGPDKRLDRPWYRVIGVTPYINTWGAFTRPNEEERLAPAFGAVYVLGGSDTAPIPQKANVRGREIHTERSASIVVRGRQSLERLPVLLRNAIHDPGNGVSVYQSDRLGTVLRLDATRRQQNFVALLFISFGLVAVSLAAFGVYAVVSHSVSQRTREFGVRRALGAGDREIRRFVLQESNVLALLGIAVGLALTAPTTKTLERLLRNTDDRFNSFVFAGVALALFVITLIASYVPARRAMRINPVEALRND